MFKRRDAPSDYCLLGTSPEARLTQFERLTLVGGSELERAVGWLARQFSEIDPGADFGVLDVAAIRQAAATARKLSPYSRSVALATAKAAAPKRRVQAKAKRR